MRYPRNSASLGLAIAALLHMSCSDGPKRLADDTVIIQLHSFTMGNDLGEPDERPAHAANLAYAIELAKSEVTNGEFVSFLNDAIESDEIEVDGDTVFKVNGDVVCLVATDASVVSPAEILYDGNEFVVRKANCQETRRAYEGEYEPKKHPVVNVSWYGATGYCNWMSRKHGLPAYYDRQNSLSIEQTGGFRLPTEAEWEGVSRRFGEVEYPWGNEEPSCERSNFAPRATVFMGRPTVNLKDSKSTCVGWTTEVAAYPEGATEDGVFDLCGNVWEWCEDWYGKYPNENGIHSTAPGTDGAKAFRGGSWTSPPQWLKPTSRGFGYPASLSYDLGFRICRTAGVASDHDGKSRLSRDNVHVDESQTIDEQERFDEPPNVTDSNQSSQSRQVVTDSSTLPQISSTSSSEEPIKVKDSMGEPHRETGNGPTRKIQESAQGTARSKSELGSTEQNQLTQQLIADQNSDSNEPIRSSRTIFLVSQGNCEKYALYLEGLISSCGGKVSDSKEVARFEIISKHNCIVLVGGMATFDATIELVEASSSRVVHVWQIEGTGKATRQEISTRRAIDSALESIRSELCSAIHE